MDNLERLIYSIKEHAHEHSSIPFWSWNDRLEQNVLAEQIKDMSQLGMRGFFMHARGGLETEYMSEEWFNAIRFCIQEAKARDMEAWAYDENGWPSGFAGGELLKDPCNHACYLAMENTVQFPAEDKDIIGVYIIKKGSIQRAKENTHGDLIVIRRCRDFSYIDTMNPEITQKYLALTHERYAHEVGEEFGKTMPGFFTDEPQYFRYGVPWSDHFKFSFADTFGYNVCDKLPLLFLELEGYEEFRYDYYLHCHRSFYRGFMKPLYEWCNTHGIQLTGHAIEEWTLGGQMMCCGGVMPFYTYQHLPGIDYLRRAVRNISGARQLGSVCEQTGKQTRLTESFASCGWDVSPKELKRIAELQFVGGVNLLCEHLYAYSERGQRKRDYPNHYSEHNPWHPYYKDFVTHFKHLGSALSQGREVAHTLVIHPIRSAYLRYCCTDEEKIAALEHAYAEFVEQFSVDHICYHFGDEGIMEELGSVEGTSIRIGSCTYSKVVIPCCETLTSNTVNLLREYLNNGGKLYLHSAAPTRVDGRRADLSFLRSNISYEQLLRENGLWIEHNGLPMPIHAQLRSTDAGKLLFITNPSEQMYNNVEITIANCEGLEELDINTLQRRPIRGQKNADGSVTVLWNFGDSASVLLVESDVPMFEPIKTEVPSEIALQQKFTLSRLPENMITLDVACFSRNYEKYSEPQPIVRIKDDLLSDRYKGRISLRYSFYTEILPKNLVLVAEPLKEMTVRINGAEVILNGESRIDRRFRSADIAGHTMIGENFIELEFPYFQREEVYRVLYEGGNESLRNCLCFDTEIEAIYLYGDFGVRSRSKFIFDEKNTYRTAGEFVLTERSQTIDLSDIVCDGYPFFAGELQAETTLTYQKGDPTQLRLQGRFAVARITVNGHALDTKLFGDTYELARYLKEGENTIQITLCFSNRNLLGPHHHKKPEPPTASPRVFSFEKQWKGGECNDYVSSYAFVKFGVSMISVGENPTDIANKL